MVDGNRSVPFDRPQCARNSVESFIALAHSLGATLSIVEAQPFLIGMHGMGDAIGHESTLVWRITASSTLTAIQRELLESSFSRLRLAHSSPALAFT